MHFIGKGKKRGLVNASLRMIRTNVVIQIAEATIKYVGLQVLPILQPSNPSSLYIQANVWETGIIGCCGAAGNAALT